MSSKFLYCPFYFTWNLQNQIWMICWIHVRCKVSILQMADSNSCHHGIYDRRNCHFPPLSFSLKRGQAQVHFEILSPWASTLTRTIIWEWNWWTKLEALESSAPWGINELAAGYLHCPFLWLKFENQLVTFNFHANLKAIFSSLFFLICINLIYRHMTGVCSIKIEWLA